MTVAAFTIAYGKEAVASARLLRATFKALHPDVPFFVVDEACWPFFARQPKAAHAGEIASLRALAGYFLALCFDRVVYFDADILLLSPVPRLLEQREGEAPVLLTHDKESFNYSLPELPRVNAGVLASSQTDFWLLWATTLYSNALRVVGGFFDQFALRLLAHRNAFPYLLLPEHEAGYHNIGYLEVPGVWRREGEAVFKGTSPVLLWHWAGYGKKPSPAYLPDPVRAVASVRLEQARTMSLPPYEEENRSLHAAIAAHGATFHAFIERELQALPFACIDDIRFANRNPPPGLFACDAPAGWEALRPVPPHLHRRLLPNAPRYLYALSEERLHEPDVEAYDRPFSNTKSP